MIDDATSTEKQRFRKSFLPPLGCSKRCSIAFCPSRDKLSNTHLYTSCMQVNLSTASPRDVVGMLCLLHGAQRLWLCLLQAGWTQILHCSFNTCLYLPELPYPADCAQTGFLLVAMLHWSVALSTGPPVLQPSIIARRLLIDPLCGLETGVQRAPALRPPLLHLPRPWPQLCRSVLKRYWVTLMLFCTEQTLTLCPLTVPPPGPPDLPFSTSYLFSPLRCSLSTQ